MIETKKGILRLHTSWRRIRQLLYNLMSLFQSKVVMKEYYLSNENKAIEGYKKGSKETTW